MGGQRWATFDCYGTLIDWNLGIRTELERLFGVEPAPRLLERYHELEPDIEFDSESFHTYREVLTLALERMAQDRPAVSPPTIATPTSIRSSSGSVIGAMNSSAGLTGGGYSAGSTAISRPSWP